MHVEAGSTKYGSALRRLEGNGCLDATTRAARAGFNAAEDGFSNATQCLHGDGPLGLARLAALGVVLEFAVREK